MSKPHPLVVDLNSQIFAAGLRIGPVLKASGVHHGTWANWAKGVPPKTSTIIRVQDAIDLLKSEKENL